MKAKARAKTSTKTRAVRMELLLLQRPEIMLSLCVFR